MSERGSDGGSDRGTDEGGSRDVEAQPPAAPSAATLAALGPDEWAWLLTPLRRALHDLDESDVTPRIARLRAAPAGRLAGGRPRGELAALIAAGGPAWSALAARLEDAQVPPTLAAALAGEVAPVSRPERAARARSSPDGHREVERLRDKLRATRAERDELRRKLEGAEVRARHDADRLQAAETAREQAQADLADLEASLAGAEEQRLRAVARERRRAEARTAKLEQELAAARGEADRREREAERRVREAREAASRRVGAIAATDPQAPPATLVPGRPSHLPADVQPGTREAVDLLLHPGRLVLVDGYNVSKQHHPELDLERQRAWLVQVLATLVARRRIRPTVVFDGERSGGRPAPGVRDVRVRFTPDGVTADDELVLAVEATDEPVVVVTDDRELTGRLRVSGADVVGTRPFLWATR